MFDCDSTFRYVKIWGGRQPECAQRKKQKCSEHRGTNTPHFEDEPAVIPAKKPICHCGIIVLVVVDKYHSNFNTGV
jgi:hypothetical protein